ncbi:MAG: TolC family protein [Phycisphaeraceae bacterium]|nr:TolC family protein [Phycisphaeraceae bacterium]
MIEGCNHHSPRGAGHGALHRACIGAAVLAVASGCSVDQKREVAAYRELAAGGAPLVFAADSPLSLEVALRLAAHHNERLGIEGENLVQSLAARRRAAATLLPTLDLFGTSTVRENVGGGGGGTDSGGSSNTARNTIFDGGLRAQYTLLTGMTDFAAASALDATIEQRRWLLLDLRETLLIETARAYYSVAVSEQLVRVIESSARVQAERLRDIRGRQEVGFARPLDVAQIESQVSATAVALLNAQNAQRNARSALSLLTGAAVHESPLTDGFAPDSGAGESLEELIALGLAHRQDVVAADAAVRAARRTVDAEIGRYYPTVTLNLDYFLTRQSVPTERDWSALLTLNLPLFSAGRIDADVRGAWSRFRQELLRFSLTRRQAETDVRIAHEQLRSAGLRVKELDRQVRAAAESLRQAEAAYAAGLGTNLERITAQDQALSAELSLARERYALKVAHLELRRSLGTLAADTLADLPRAPVRRFEGVPLPESPFINAPGLPAAPVAAGAAREGG